MVEDVARAEVRVKLCSNGAEANSDAVSLGGDDTTTRQVSGDGDHSDTRNDILASSHLVEQVIS
jgi:hypothetical protein